MAGFTLPPPSSTKDFTDPMWQDWLTKLSAYVKTLTSIAWSALVLPTVSQSTFLGGPSSGSGTAAFRVIVPGDLGTGTPTQANYLRGDGSWGNTPYSYQTPATGFSIVIGNTTPLLVLNPSGALSTGTITMPASPTDGMVVKFSSSQAITTLTVSPNTGQSILNAPTTLAAGGSYSFIYVASVTTWFII